MNKHTLHIISFLLVALLAFGACSEDTSNGTTADVTSDEDTTTTDTTTADTTTADTTTADTTAADTTAADTTAADTTTTDTTAADTTTADTTTTDTTADTTTTCNLDETSCEIGEVFDADGCICKPIVAETDCQAPEDICDPNEPQVGLAYVCVDLGDGTGTCTQTCDDGGFFGDECAEGYKCYPSEFSPILSTDFCDLIGTGAGGEVCGTEADAGDGCISGLICVAGVCETPNCSPDTDRGPSCAPEDVCSGLNLGDQSIDIGFCQTPCAPFSDSCGAGQFCSPSLFFDASGDPLGFCIDSREGSSGQGAFCTDDSECQDNLYCLRTCEPLCDPTSADGTSGSCDTDETCSLLTDGDGVSFDIGYCQGDCDYDLGISCADSSRTCIIREIASNPDDYCVTVTVRAEGEACLEEFNFCDSSAICLSSNFGTGFDGTACVDICRTNVGNFGDTDHPDCTGNVEGRVCNSTFQDLPFGSCSTFDCDPTLLISENTSCDASSDICTPISGDNPNVGRCQESCEFSTSADSCPSGEECSPSEFVNLFAGSSVGSDLCRSYEPASATVWPSDNFDPCTEETNGLLENQACAPFSLCLDIGMGESLGFPIGTPVCHQMCRSSEGAFGALNHPDCPNDADTCTEIFADASFPGICLP